MSKTAHTPGPWAVKGEADVYDARGDYVAACYAGDLDEQEANARLIAAAPELVDAGSRVLDYATLDGILSDTERHDNSVFAIRLGDLRALRAAIRKATGEA